MKKAKEKKYVFGNEFREISCNSCDIFSLGKNPRLIAVYYRKENGNDDFSLLLLKKNFDCEKDVVVGSNKVNINPNSVKEELDFKFKANERSVVHICLSSFFSKREIFEERYNSDEKNQLIERKKNCIYLVKSNSKKEDSSKNKSNTLIEEISESSINKTSYIQSAIENSSDENIFEKGTVLIRPYNYSENGLKVISRELSAKLEFSISFPCFSIKNNCNFRKPYEIYDEISSVLSSCYLLLYAEYGSGKHTLVNNYIENCPSIKTIIRFDLNGQRVNTFTALKPTHTNILGKCSDEYSTFWELLRKSGDDVVVILDNYVDTIDKYVLTSINKEVIGNAKVIVISNADTNEIKPPIGFTAKEPKDFKSFKDYANDIVNFYFNKDPSSKCKYYDFLEKINYNFNALIKYSKDFEKTKYKDFDDFINNYDEVKKFNKYSLIENYLNYYCDESSLNVFRLLFALPNYYRNTETVVNILGNSSLESEKKYEKILNNLNIENIIKIDSNGAISLDPYIEKYLYNDMYFHYKDNIVNESLVSYIEILKNILVSDEYKKIGLLFVTLDKYSKFNYDDSFVLRKKSFTNDLRDLLQELIAKNNNNVNASKVVSELIPLYIEHLIFYDTELFVCSKPERRSFILKNKNNIAIYDFDAKKTYVLNGKLVDNYTIVGHFGNFYEGFDDPKNNKSVKLIKIPENFYSYKHEKNDYNGFFKKTKEKIYTAMDARKIKSTFNLNEFAIIYKSALKESILKYQGFGSDNDLRNLLICLNQQIVYYNMHINYGIGNENIEKYVSLSESYMRSLDFILSLDGLALSISDIADRKIGMAYHRGVLEYHKGNIDKAIEYYRNGIAIARDYLQTNTTKNDYYYDMLYNISFNSNQIGNCYYEKLCDEMNDFIFSYAEENYKNAIKNINDYCKYIDNKGFYPAVLGLYYNNLGRLYSLNPKYYQKAYKSFDSSIKLLDNYKTIDKRIADYKVAYINNKNELMQSDNVQKNKTEIYNNYLYSFELIDNYELNHSVKARNYDGYIRFKIKIGNISNEEIEKFNNIKSSLNHNNPRHAQRIKEMKKTKMLIDSYKNNIEASL